MTMKRKKTTAVLLSLIMLSGSAVLSVHATDGWRKVYETVLTEFQGTDYFVDDESFGSMWNIFDINSDGVPELFVSVSASHVGGCAIYAFQDGEGIRLGEEEQFFGEWGVTSACQAESLVKSEHFNMGLLDVAYYHFDGTSLELVDRFSNDEGAQVGGNATYYHNGEVVTKEEYLSAINPYDAMHWVNDIGREYYFSQLDLFKGDIPPAKVPVVLETLPDKRPDLKTALLYGGIPALIIALISAMVSIIWRHS